MRGMEDILLIVMCSPVSCGARNRKASARNLGDREAHGYWTARPCRMRAVARSDGGLSASRANSPDFMDAAITAAASGRDSLFDDNPTIHCPYFAERIVLNGEGLHHLRYFGERERSKPEQMLKFRLLPLAP